MQEPYSDIMTEITRQQFKAAENILRLNETFNVHHLQETLLFCMFGMVLHEVYNSSSSKIKCKLSAGGTAYWLKMSAINF